MLRTHITVGGAIHNFIIVFCATSYTDYTFYTNCTIFVRECADVLVMYVSLHILLCLAFSLCYVTFFSLFSSLSSTA